jgi:hypothetical protein
LNEWCLIGPGAIGGLNHMLKKPLAVSSGGKLDVWNNQRAIELMRILTSDQDCFLEHREFKYLTDADDKPKLLTLQDIEFGCCEFRKRLKILAGGSHRLYKPRDEVRTEAMINAPERESAAEAV